MPNKRGVLREDEMRLPWLVLLLFPFFPLPDYPPGFEYFRFITGKIAAVVVFSDLARYWYLFPISDYPIPSLPCDIVFTFLRRYEFAVSAFPPCASMRTCRYQPSAQYLRVSARDRMFFHGAFNAQTPNTALIPPCQTSRSGIHSAVLCHDSF